MKEPVRVLAVCGERKEQTSMSRARREAAFTVAMVAFLLAIFWAGTVGSVY